MPYGPQISKRATKVAFFNIMNSCTPGSLRATVEFQSFRRWLLATGGRSWRRQTLRVDAQTELASTVEDGLLT